MKWYSSTGCWDLIGNHKSKIFIGGTTPRNADHFTFTVRLWNFHIYLDLGKHFSFNPFWINSKTEEETGLDIRRRFCRSSCFPFTGVNSCGEVWAIEWTYKDECHGWSKRKPHTKHER